MRGASGWIATLMLGLAVSGGQAWGDEPRLAEYFGFHPLEIYKLDNRISGLLVRDLDGDKIDDVAVINNARSRIDLLLSGQGPSDDGTPRNEANQVPSDRRMRLKRLPVNKEVISLQAGDFNGDGKLDLAYYGTPAELIVLLNQGEGRFGAPVRKTVGEAVESATALAVGDLNRDGRDDLALLTANDLVLVLQTADGKLGEPERLPHACGSPRMLRAVDLDGDGGDDLVILDGGNDDPVRVRFSAEGGTLGPEQRFQVEPPRAISFANLDGRAGAEVLTIEAQSGRAKVLTLAEADDEGDETERRGRLVVFPLPKGDARGRSTAPGDLDGDGKTDVVVTDPAAAEVLVYLQKPGGLAAAQTFPGLVGGKAVQVADLDGDGKAEVVVLSEAEKQIGLSRFQDGRLSFPTPLPISGEPVALDLADLDGDKQPEIVYLTRGRDGSETFDLRALKREKSGSFVPFRWGLDDSAPVKGLSGNPPALRVLDANRDNLADVLIFNAFGPPVLLLGRPGGEPPAPAGGSLGPLADVSPTGLSLNGPDGPALIVAQNGYARDLVLDKTSGQWQIKDQYNAGRPSARIVAASAIDLDGDGKAEIALFDRNSRSLLFLDHRDGVYRPGGTLSVGPIDLQATHSADLDGDGRPDLLLAGSDKFGVVLTGRKGVRLKTLASYETPRKDASLADLAVGDLNADGRPDLTLIDTAEHVVELVTQTRPSDLVRALSFKVFEQKSSRRERDADIEPRDLALGDLNGDGRQDLVLIVHDRILIYLQDAGQSDSAK